VNAPRDVEMVNEHRELAPDERLDVEVLVDGVWYPGQLRAWSRPGAERSGWWGNVSYRTVTGQLIVATVRENRIRVTQPPVDHPS
jgi:hypothetical protein